MITFTLLLIFANGKTERIEHIPLDTEGKMCLAMADHLKETLGIKLIAAECFPIDETNSKRK